jgi:hypothetical protein
MRLFLLFFLLYFFFFFLTHTLWKKKKHTKEKSKNGKGDLRLLIKFEKRDLGPSSLMKLNKSVHETLYVAWRCVVEFYFYFFNIEIFNKVFLILFSFFYPSKPQHTTTHNNTEHQNMVWSRY